MDRSGWWRLRAPTSVGALRGLTGDEVASLRRAGVGTAEDLRDRVASEGLELAAEHTGVAAGRLRRALARHALREAAGRTRPPAGRVLARARACWPELALAAAAVLVAAGLLRAARVPEREVVAARDLAPFHVVAAGDVETRRAQTGFDTHASPGDVVGRFPLQAVAAGKPLPRDGLSRVRFARPEELRGRRIVSLPAAPHALPLAVPGTRVALLLAPLDPRAPGTVVDDVMVLDARGEGDAASLVVAIPEAALAGVVGSLGSSRATVLQHVRPNTVPAAPPPRPAP